MKALKIFLLILLISGCNEQPTTNKLETFKADNGKMYIRSIVNGVVSNSEELPENQGEKGKDGEPGIQGPPGESGTVYHETTIRDSTHEFILVPDTTKRAQLTMENPYTLKWQRVTKDTNCNNESICRYRVSAILIIDYEYSETYDTSFTFKKEWFNSGPTTFLPFVCAIDEAGNVSEKWNPGIIVEVK